MQNIDLLVLLEPTLGLGTALLALIAWWYKKGLRGIILPLTAGAYFIAIAGKEAIQIPTVGYVVNTFGATSAVTGLYLGLQTVFLEVGLAYLFALYAVRKRGLKEKDAVPYGLSLAFWENGILLGVLSIINIGVAYLLIAGGGPASSTVYSQLASSQPALFEPPLALLPGELIGTLERISSMLIHLAFGMLTVYAAVTGRKRYLAYAMPMGLVDAFVPFAHLNTDLFEGGLFVVSLLFVLVAWRAARSVALGSTAAMPTYS